MVSVFINKELNFQIEGLEKEEEKDYITDCIKKYRNWEPNVTEKFVMIFG